MVFIIVTIVLIINPNPARFPPLFRLFLVNTVCFVCRGGTAVAQAGNVAVPGAAREHFPSSAPAAAAAAAAGLGVDSPRIGRSDLGKRKTSDLGRAYCALDDEEDDGGARAGDLEDDRPISTPGSGGIVTNRNIARL